MMLTVNTNPLYSFKKQIPENIVAKIVNFFKVHVLFPNFDIYPVIFFIFLAGAAYIRFWAAPLSAGVDIPQFWGFARTFQLYGLDFYRYADAQLDLFPVKGWGYVYPPVWLLISRLALAAVPGSIATADMVDSAWRLAMKTPIIAADLAIGCLLYWAIPGSKLKKLFFSALWLFHPSAWYNSGVFGQFDPIAAVFLLAFVILLYRGRDRWAFFFAGLAFMTKQHVLIPIVFMAAASIKELGWRRILTGCGIMAGVAAAFSIPFMVTGNAGEYLGSVIFPGGSPGYQEPLSYSFSGGASVLTYLHNAYGWDTKGVFPYFIPVMIAALLAAVYFSYRRRITPSQAALAGFLVFISLNYRVNYQYLLIFIPLALWVAAISRYKFEKVFTCIMALLPIVWLWLYDVSFWFICLAPKHKEVFPIFEHLGWARRDLPDLGFVIFTVVLACVFITYVILAFTIWRNRGNGAEKAMIKPDWQKR
jgi:hypothetical protein